MATSPRLTRDLAPTGEVKVEVEGGAGGGEIKVEGEMARLSGVRLLSGNSSPPRVVNSCIFGSISERLG